MHTRILHAWVAWATHARTHADRRVTSPARPPTNSMVGLSTCAYIMCAAVTCCLRQQSARHGMPRDARPVRLLQRLHPRPPAMIACRHASICQARRRWVPCSGASSDGAWPMHTEAQVLTVVSVCVCTHLGVGGAGRGGQGDRRHGRTGQTSQRRQRLRTAPCPLWPRGRRSQSCTGSVSLQAARCWTCAAAGCHTCRRKSSTPR